MDFITGGFPLQGFDPALNPAPLHPEAGIDHARIAKGRQGIKGNLTLRPQQQA